MYNQQEIAIRKFKFLFNIKTADGFNFILSYV